MGPRSPCRDALYNRKPYMAEAARSLFQLREIDVEPTGDAEQRAEVEHWERGSPRQASATRKSLWLSRVDP